MEYSALYSERVIMPVEGALSFTRFRLRVTDSVDRLRFRADYTLGPGSNGIDPTVQPVTIMLSTPGGGPFYPSPDFNPLTGFDVQGHMQKRRWTLDDAERQRTGIERFDLTDNGDGTGAVFLRDMRITLPMLDYSTVDMELLVGDDLLTGTVHLREKPRRSGKWRLDD